MPSALAKSLRWLAGALGLLLLIAGVAAVWFHAQVRGSLPQLDGSQPLSGLAADVVITRDALGVPTVRGANRSDVARALGFLHAQDRFFQMDLLRRRAAGELAELFGPAALPLDRRVRPHRFRQLAQQVLQAAPPHHRAWLQAYTAGVNEGLGALSRKPFEYYVLRAAPQAWRTEDSILIAYTMVLDLQDPTNTYEFSLMTLRDQFGYGAVPFFAPLLTPDDATLDGSAMPFAAVPGPRVIDLRQTRPIKDRSAPRDRGALALAQWLQADPELHPGSNSMALTGAHTATGAAMLANDPHLNLGVPNIWYRTVLEWPATADETAGEPHRVVGGTLPGLPFVVIGSNGHIAWGLTTSFADTGDLIPIDVNPVSHDLYKIPGSDELRPIEKHEDTIAVKGAPAETVESFWTHWGIIVGRDARERPLAHRWIADEPAAINLRFIDLESARSAADAIAIAHEAGIPAHNFLVADRAGAIGWTVAGRIPHRVGFDGRMPVSWTFGDRRWDGFLAASNVPTLLLPGEAGNLPPGLLAQSGRLWTANNRLMGGTALALLGDGGYMAPFRAVQVRDRLAAVEKATPRDLLALQLDDRALFLERWQQLLLATLTPETTTGHDSRAELRRLAAHWEGHASTDSVSYRLVRLFRTEVALLTFEPIFERCLAQTPQFDWRRFNYEAPLWTLLQEKPPHLLSPRFDSWEALLLAAADRVITTTAAEEGALSRATWGRRNTAQIRHPLRRVLPAMFAPWLDLPADPLPGDTHMPRVQNPSFGASMRFVVSPGHEDEGIFEMPGGQSGHPLSPFFRAGHEAWVRGEPSPLLPGKTVHTLTLTPAVAPH